MNRPMFSLRPYRTEDCVALAALFYETVHAVNARDYTPPQLDAWATGEVDLDAWDRSFQEHDTVIAEQNGSIVGFGDMDASGYLSTKTARAGEWLRQSARGWSAAALRQSTSPMLR